MVLVLVIFTLTVHDGGALLSGSCFALSLPHLCFWLGGSLCAHGRSVTGRRRCSTSCGGSSSAVWLLSGPAQPGGSRPPQKVPPRLSKHSSRRPAECPTISACKGLWVVQASRGTAGGIVSPPVRSPQWQVKRVDSNQVPVLLSTERLAGFPRAAMKGFDCGSQSGEHGLRVERLGVWDADPRLEDSGSDHTAPSFVCFHLLLRTAYEQFEAASLI